MKSAITPESTPPPTGPPSSIHTLLTGQSYRPLLRTTLVLHRPALPGWGKERTDADNHRWAELDRHQTLDGSGNSVIGWVERLVFPGAFPLEARPLGAHSVTKRGHVGAVKPRFRLCKGVLIGRALTLSSTIAVLRTSPHSSASYFGRWPTYVEWRWGIDFHNW